MQFLFWQWLSAWIFFGTSMQAFTPIPSSTEEKWSTSSVPHTEVHQQLGSILGFVHVNLCKIFWWISEDWENEQSSNLEKNILYQSSIISKFVTLSTEWFLLCDSASQECFIPTSPPPWCFEWPWNSRAHMIWHENTWVEH